MVYAQTREKWKNSLGIRDKKIDHQPERLEKELTSKEKKKNLSHCGLCCGSRPQNKDERNTLT